MGAMNRGLNLPGIQKIMTEFEKENATMDMKEEMMSDAVDDVMDEEDEEEEGDQILKAVLDEIGIDLSQQLGETPTGIAAPVSSATRQPVALGETAAPSSNNDKGDDSGSPGGGGGGMSDEDTLQARLDALRRG